MPAPAEYLIVSLVGTLIVAENFAPAAYRMVSGSLNEYINLVPTLAEYCITEAFASPIEYVRLAPAAYFAWVKKLVNTTGIGDTAATTSGDDTNAALAVTDGALPVVVVV